MTGDQECSCKLLWFVAVILLLFSLAPGLTCHSLQGLTETLQQEKQVNEAAATEVRTGRILFNGKDINVRSRPSSVDNGGLAHVDLPQSDGTGMLRKAAQPETTQEAAWRSLNPLLSCGQTKMKLKAMGPGAAYLQLDMGLFNGIVQSLPLMQVPTSCGYSMRQNALGLILVVPYDGCSVVQENGYNVLPLSWLQNPVKLACPLSQSATTAAPPPTTAEATTTTTSTTQSTVAPATSAPATAPTTSTAQPVTTAISSAPTTGGLPVLSPSANPNVLFYPIFRLPPATPSTGITAQPSTPAMPTTGPASQLPVEPNTQYPYNIWDTSDPLSNGPPTTASPTPTPGLPVQPNPNYPIYQNYPVGIPSQSAFYYPYIQPPYPQNLNPSTSSGYLDLIGQYHSYNWLPFRQYMWQQKRVYLPGIHTRVQPYPGFWYQQPKPWFFYSGQDSPQFGWQN